MKFEKREITLNEYDSMLDMLGFSERLLELYRVAVAFAERKEVRSRLKESMLSTMEEIYFLKDVLEGIKAEQV